MKTLCAKRGAVLILTFIIMVTIAVVTVVFLYVTSIQTKASGYDIQSSKALWIAEGGLQKYFLRLRDETYTSSNIPNLNENLGDGSYLVTCSYDDSVDPPVYTITSTGTVDVVSRKIQQTAIETSAALERAIHADSAHVKLEGSTGGTVNGNISCFTSVQNEEDLANYSDFTDGTYTITDGNEQDKILPTMDLSMYLALAQADDDPPDDVHVALGTGEAGRITLGAGTHDGVYYATNQIIIEDGAVIHGSVVCEKRVLFEDGPTIVTIKPELSTRAQGDGKNYAAVIGGEGGIISLDTGSLHLRHGLKDSTINGLVLCTHSGSDIKFNYTDNAIFNGTIIASGNIELMDTAASRGLRFVINYDEGIFSPMIEGFGFTAGGDLTVLLQDDWNEIPAT